MLAATGVVWMPGPGPARPWREREGSALAAFFVVVPARFAEALAALVIPRSNADPLPIMSSPAAQMPDSR